MKAYLDFQPEDFAADEFFIRWVKSADIEAETFWQNWLETYPFMRQKVEIARKMVLLTDSLPVPPVADLEIAALKRSVLKRIEDQENGRIKVRRLSPLVYWAAVVAGLALFAAWWAQIYQDRPDVLVGEPMQDEAMKVVSAGPDKRLVILSDGSSALLKKNSKIIFPASFEPGRREVYLVGEAFFEVAKDSLRPFFVRTHDYTTRVLGTSFNVRAYPEDGRVSVFVKTGKVSVYRSDRDSSSEADNPLVLMPNQQGFFQKETSPRLTEELPPAEQKAVPVPDIDRMRFEYDEVLVGDIFEQIEKAYNVKIRYDKSVFGQCPVTASLTGEPFDEKLKLVTLAVRANFRIENDQVFITGLGCDRDKN
ncbi:FecR family protein [Ravibacter arvi]|uniref:FecR family protein n=1 Tax=Ravibacter arvi TaxID=2051041 RepID=A0ABP8MA33_9BACT